VLHHRFAKAGPVKRQVILRRQGFEQFRRDAIRLVQVRSDPPVDGLPIVRPHRFEDPRDPSKCRHQLIDLVVIAIAAVLCGANDLANIEAFGKAKIKWFRRFLDLENGIPSHDTFGRVFALLSPKAFQACFRGWIESVRRVYADEVIAIDGKTLRRSHDRKGGLGPLHIVSAWATRNGLVLGQQATDAKSNEITAIPELLEVLLLKGCIVTIDAMGCQKKIAQQIRDQGGD
jgi:hypothetical protein